MATTIRQLATQLDIEFIRGDDLYVPLGLKANVGTEEEPVLEPIDVTNWTFLAQVRAKAKSDDVLTTWDVAIVDGPAGEIEIVLSAEKTSLLSKEAVYDLQVTTDLGRRRTWVRGVLRPELDVSRTEPEPTS